MMTSMVIIIIMIVMTAFLQDMEQQAVKYVSSSWFGMGYHITRMMISPSCHHQSCNIDLCLCVFPCYLILLFHESGWLWRAWYEQCKEKVMTTLERIKTKGQHHAIIQSHQMNFEYVIFDSFTKSWNIHIFSFIHSYVQPIAKKNLIAIMTVMMMMTMSVRWWIVDICTFVHSSVNNEPYWQKKLNEWLWAELTINWYKREGMTDLVYKKHKNIYTIPISHHRHHHRHRPNQQSHRHDDDSLLSVVLMFLFNLFVSLYH